jgi:transposase InsO family protein
MDFVVGLPESDGYNAVWVVVDRLSNMKHLVPCRDNTDGKKLGEMFIMEVFKLHGLPDSMVSDRGPQFASEFWRHVCKRLGIVRKLSTAFHPQTDGQTERINAVMEQYLRVFVNYQQDNWTSWLPIAEFATNNHTSETTGCSPSFGNYGFDPRMTFSQHPVQENNDIREVNANTLPQKMKEIFEQMRTEMARAQSIQTEQADKHRREGVELKPGDRVWMDARNISTQDQARNWTGNTWDHTRSPKSSVHGPIV